MGVRRDWMAIAAALVVAVTVAAAGPAAAGSEWAGTRGIGAALDNTRVAMRSASSDRLQLIADLIDGCGDALACSREDRRQWALERAMSLASMGEIEVERGLGRSEDVTEAVAALERATTRARERLGELLDHTPEAAREALWGAQAAMERCRAAAARTLQGIADGQIPGSPDAARVHLGGAGRPASPGKGPGGG